MANELLKLAGGAGCDITSGTGAFTPRGGRKIYAVSPRADSAGITSFKEDQNGNIVTVSSRSYVGTNTLNKGEIIIFDYPVTEFTPAAQTFIVYYLP